MSLLYECIHTIITGIPNHNAAMQVCVSVSVCINLMIQSNVFIKVTEYPQNSFVGALLSLFIAATEH